MATKNLATDERIASRRLLGVDGRGYTHRWDSYYRAVYVFDGDDYLGRFDIGDGSLSGHVKRIREEFGPWAETNVSKHPFDGIKVLG